MNTQPRRGIFPWFTIIEGIMGFLLQCWLFSAINADKLLPNNHIAGIACYCLLALTMVICWLGSRKEEDLCPDKLFFPSGPAAVGIGLSALGLGISSITIGTSGILQILALATGILAAAALGYIAVCRAKKFHADAMLHCIITLHLILRTMVSCSVWSAQPQFQQYFFPLLACVFLMITSYYRAALALGLAHSKKYVFFSQAALFCCFMCCRGSDWLFYLSAVLWLTFDCPAPSAVTEELSQDE